MFTVAHLAAIAFRRTQSYMRRLHAHRPDFANPERTCPLTRKRRGWFVILAGSRSGICTAGLANRW